MIENAQGTGKAETLIPIENRNSKSFEITECLEKLDLQNKVEELENRLKEALSGQGEQGERKRKMARET